MDESLPQPPLILRIASVVVIGVATFIATMAVVAALLVPDPLVALTNLVLGMPAGLLAVEQYFATYKYNPRAAKISQWLLSAIGGVGIIGMALLIVFDARMDDPTTLVCLAPGVAGSSAILVGDMNGRWAANLRSPRWNHLRARPFQVSITEILVLNTTVALCLAMSVWVLRH